MGTDDSQRMGLRVSDNAPFKITREIPLPWLVAGLVAFAGQAIGVYYNQQNLASQLTTQTADIKLLAAKIDTVIDKRNEDTVKTIQRDNRTERNTDRISALEDLVKQRLK